VAERSGDTAFVRIYAIKQGKLFARTKAVLKSPHSGRWRDCQPPADLAERLDCGVFTAAFVRPTRSRTNQNLRPRESGVALRFPPQSKTSRNSPAVFQKQAAVLFEPLWRGCLIILLDHSSSARQEFLPSYRALSKLLGGTGFQPVVSGILPET
jgi:hypothetical protein